MKRASLNLMVLFTVLLSRTAIADIFSSGPQVSNLGNIASDGSGGRQIQIRPLEAEDIGQTWKFFPPHDALPQIYPAPTPATPAQDDILLTASDPLLLVLPQLQHFPEGANVAVSHSLTGNEILVDASIQFLGYSTDTIYGPHEYLHPLWTLAAGQYHLILNLTSSFLNEQPSLTTGYIDFVVHTVPEPAAAWLLAYASVGIYIRRLR